ncbi:MAG: hypothetical protein ABI614_24190, partial [Planctomycetota bacterium]
MLLFLLFSLLSMGQIAFVGHIVSLFLVPLIAWRGDPADARIKLKSLGKSLAFRDRSTTTALFCLGFLTVRFAGFV